MAKTKIFLIRLWPIYTAGCYRAVDRKKCISTYDIITSYERKLCDRKNYAV